MQKVTQMSLARGVNLTCVNALKFKTGCLSITFLTELNRKTAALGAALPYVLRRGTSSHPDMESLAQALDDLYGARIEPVLRKKGEVQCIGLYADFPDDVFVPGGGHILEKTARLMGEILLSPATSGGRLRADYVDSERQNLIDDIRAEINDKRVYAYRHMVERMFNGEKYSISKLGTLEEASKITVYSLTRYYKEVLANSAAEVFYCGAEDPDTVARIVKEALAPLPRSGSCTPPETEFRAKVPGQIRHFTEKMAVAQGRLVMGYRLGEIMQAPDHPALMTFNAVFGGAATSKLFMNVREKLGLCYYADSGIDRHKGVMVVSSGIEFDKYNEALAEITSQLESVKNGDIAGWELEGAKKAVMNSLYTSMDEPSGLESLYLNRALLGIEANPEEIAALVSEVTKEEVADIAASVKLDTVYFLTGEDRDAEAV